MISESAGSHETADKVLAAIAQMPMMSEAEIRTAIFGEPYSHDINPTIRRLLRLGRIERHGKGGLGEIPTATRLRIVRPRNRTSGAVSRT